MKTEKNEPLTTGQILVTEPHSGRMTLIVVTLLIFGATLPYLTAVNGQFVIDDTPLIVEGRDLSEDGAARAALTRPSFGPAVYRPLWVLGFALQNEIFDVDPRGYHVVSIAFHALCSFLVFFVLRGLLEDSRRLPAFFGALVFAAHPVHVEAVAWISAVCHVQATALCLAALHCYLEWQKQGNSKLLIGSVLCAALAVLFQEISVIFPALVVMIDVSRGRKGKATQWIPYFAVSASYLVLRRVVLGVTLPFRIESVDAALRIPEFVAAYVKSLVLPFPQFMFLREVPANFAGGWSYFVAFFVVSACFLLIVARPKERIFAIQGVLWFTISILPALYAAFHGTAAFALRFLYLPSVAMAIIVASAAAGGGSLWRRAFAAAVVVISVTGAFVAASANRGWINDEIAYGRIIEFAPSDLSARNSLALYYRDRGRTNDAIAAFQEVIRLSEGKDRANAFAELGAVYGEAGHLVASREAYLQAREIDDGLSDAWLGLGNLAFLEGRFPDAISNYDAALERDPENYEACFNLAMVYRRTGDVERALALERRAQRIDRE